MRRSSKRSATSWPSMRRMALRCTICRWRYKSKPLLVPDGFDMTTPDQVLEQILKAVFGPVVPGGDAIRVAARRLAEPPNNDASGALAQFCQQFVYVYKGWNYNI